MHFDYLLCSSSLPPSHRTAIPQKVDATIPDVPLYVRKSSGGRRRSALGGGSNGVFCKNPASYRWFCPDTSRLPAQSLRQAIAVTKWVEESYLYYYYYFFFLLLFFFK